MALLLAVVAMGLALLAWWQLRPSTNTAHEPGSEANSPTLSRETVDEDAAVTSVGKDEASADGPLESADIVLLRLSTEVLSLLVEERGLEESPERKALAAQFSVDAQDERRRQDLSRQLTNFAIHLADLGKLREAMKVLDEGARYHRDGGVSMAWKARLLLRLGRREDARKLIAQQREIFPESVTLLRLAAEIERMTGQDAAGLALLERALQLSPEAPGLDEEVARAREETRAMATFLTDASAHFDLRYDPAQAEVVQAMPELGALVEDAWQDVLAATGLRPEQRVVIMFLKPDRYRAAAPDWSSGLYDGRVRLVLDHPEQQMEQLARTLRHELTHAALFTLGVPLPTWLQEGLAQQVEGADATYARQALAAQGALTISAADLSGNWTRWSEEEQVREAYFYALSLTVWLGQEYGSGIWSNLFQNLPGRDFEGAWQLTFGQSFAEIDARHRSTLF